MIVHFKNLGPLRQADFDLNKRLMVFAGPNHSGKTQAAWSLYGLMTNISLSWDAPSKAGLLWVEKLATEGGMTPELVSLGHQRIQEAVISFKDGLATFFSVPREIFDGTEISVDLADHDLMAPNIGLQVQVILEKSRNFSASTSTTEKPEISITFLQRDSPNATDTPSDRVISFLELPEERRSEILRFVKLVLIYQVLEPLRGGNYAIFPTERSAIPMFSHEIGKRRSELVDQILLKPGRERQIASESARRYPRPIMDCIQISNDLANISRTQSAFVDLAEQLEALLGGQVKISTYGDIGFTRAGANKPTVPFSLSASVVKSLAALVVYFRHQANEHDTIVIDEPELNLHPDVQIHLARFLGQVVNRGFRVIMSTHSDFILRELSNLVRLGEGGEQGQALGQRLGLTEKALLNAAKVGVWYFHDGEAEALPITGAGFHLPSIEAAIHNENIETQEITFGLDDA